LDVVLAKLATQLLEAASAVLLSVIAFVYSLMRREADARVAIGIGGIGGMIVIGLMALYPQMMFKPQRRSLVMNASGLETSVGKHHARRPWSDIRSVKNADGYIILARTNGNAFIVPPRAFESPEMRDAFLSFARQRMSVRQAGTN
jgi:YcxB-like protein